MLGPEQASVRGGLPFTPLTELYLRLLQGSWLGILVVFSLVFLLANVGFAGLYLAGGDCISGARPGSFADAFFFSVQTIATIGYGGLVPNGTYANVLVTIESMVGLLGVALAAGVVFAKLERPGPTWGPRTT
ncbi:Kef-type K+ transport systems protein [Enhygromyxa salina]|uniref:Kef-type K+ transport systems protein n=1 Tax=Enhygromyxa salina TaxID=215803 RepID=A0A0C2DE92_9BACT|nr:Kef-type K+ transport systems protein [Enhygromyxa salina]